MPYVLPDINLHERPLLQFTQIAALRALVIYLSGLRSQKRIFKPFPNLSDNDIRSFKHGRLLFDTSTDDVRLHAFYRAVFECFRLEMKTHPAFHDSVIPLLRMVYPPPPPPEVNQKRGNPAPPRAALEAAGTALYSLFSVSEADVDRMHSALTGVYFLYRRGDLEHKKPELVRCALLVRPVQTQSGILLTFSLNYKRRFGVDAVGNPSASIHGVVIPHGVNCSLAGIDDASHSSPMLCTITLSAAKSPAQYYDAMMLRKNTAGRVVSTRCALVRLSNAMDDAALRSQYDDAKASVDILPDGPQAFQQDESQFALVSDLIDNLVDNRMRYVLADRPRSSDSVPLAQINTGIVPPFERKELSEALKNRLRGDYINVRFAADGFLRLSHMCVTDSLEANCLTFFTQRSHASGIRSGRGLIYRLGEKWIADGVVESPSEDAGMRRLTILFDRQRDGSWLGDLAGLRLTSSIADGTMISSHVIFCCKLSSISQLTREKIGNGEMTSLTESDFKKLWPDVYRVVEKELLQRSHRTLTVRMDAVGRE